MGVGFGNDHRSLKTTVSLSWGCAQPPAASLQVGPHWAEWEPVEEEGTVSRLTLDSD